MKKLLTKSPVFCLILLVGILLTIAAFLGRKELYVTQEHDPWREPYLTLVMKGIQEDIYPWQLFDESAKQMIVEKMPMVPPEGEDLPIVLATPTPLAPATPHPTMVSPHPSPLPSPTPRFPEGRLEPLRESTYEEYLNHVSADIYGDLGVQRAADYSFSQVDESYFDDALFIGDSRTVGLRDYTDLSEHADFLCATSLTVYKVMDESFKGMGTVREVLENKDYGKIYLMVGINELGRGTTEDYMEKYTEIVDTIRELEPEAILVLQASMKVSGSKSNSDSIFNNGNITARNHAIATLADNKTIFYVDMNEAVCDENGDLCAEYTHDQIHLLGKYNDLWKQFLLSHGICE